LRLERLCASVDWIRSARSKSESMRVVEKLGAGSGAERLKAFAERGLHLVEFHIANRRLPG
jgi:hypothetical protein